MATSRKKDDCAPSYMRARFCQIKFIGDGDSEMMTDSPGYPLEQRQPRAGSASAMAGELRAFVLKKASRAGTRALASIIGERGSIL
jgi:hypothetical protein